MKRLLLYVILLTFQSQLYSFQNDIVISCEKINNAISSYECTNVRVTAIDTQDGIILVDTHRSPSIMRAVLDSVRTTFSNKPIRYVVNTHGHWDHTGGNQLFDPSIIIGHKNITEFMKQFPANTIANCWQVTQIKEKYEKELSLAHGNDRSNTNNNIDTWESILNDFKNDYILAPPGRLVKTGDKISSGKLTLEFYSCGYLHTNHDLFVLIPQLKVLFVGDVLSTYSQWSFNQNALTDLEGLKTLLVNLLKNNPDLEYVIPAHGKPFPAKDLTQTIALLDEKIKHHNQTSSAAYYLQQEIPQSGFDEALKTLSSEEVKSTLHCNEEEFSQLAREYESLGMLDESLIILNTALSLLSKPILIYDDLGRVYEKLGNKERAIESYKTLLKLFPRYHIARYLLEKLQNDN